MAKKTPTTEMDKIQSRKLKKIFEDRQYNDKSLTQKSLAADLDVSESTISRILSGDLGISAVLAMAISTRLGCHPSEFHDEFARYSDLPNLEVVELFRQYVDLSPDDQSAVQTVIQSLASKP